MKFKELLKKFKTEKGITGVDVAVAISIVVLTIGVVTAIYINTTNKSKESIRYSAATRIATQIVENIQSMTYDELVYRCSNSSYSSSSSDSDGNIFGVNVPTGYSASVTAPEITSNEVDVIRDVTVNVSFSISNTTETITLYTTKEKELLEQTNRPDLNLIEDYSDSSYYAIKYQNGNYIVTATSDEDWYNYDDGYYALLLKSSTNYEYGTSLNSSNITSGGNVLYVWVPRFGLSGSNLAYCYGTSNYKITFSLYDNSLYGYMLTGTGSGNNYSVTGIDSYVNGTFASNDGLTGVWYKPFNTSENTAIETAAFNSLNSYKAAENF